MMNAPFKIVFMGTASFAVPSLKKLLDHGYQIAAVVTAPDKPAGRGRKIRYSPVKEFALENKLNILQPEKLKNESFVSHMKAINPDIQVVVAFRMLPEIIWKLPKKGTFNLHSSLLPQFRGAAPINHAIINGFSETGVTTFFIDEKIDTGQIIFREKTGISESETAGELHDRLMVLGAELVVKTVKAIEAGAVKLTPQEELIKAEDKIYPAPKIFREDCKINWEDTAADIHNFIRGLSPIPGAHSTIEFQNGNHKGIKIFRSQKTGEKAFGKPGVIRFVNSGFEVACSDGIIRILEIQLEGKRKMTTEEFLRGINTKEVVRLA